MQNGFFCKSQKDYLLTLTINSVNIFAAVSLMLLLLLHLLDHMPLLWCQAYEYTWSF